MKKLTFLLATLTLLMLGAAPALACGDHEPEATASVDDSTTQASTTKKDAKAKKDAKKGEAKTEEATKATKSTETNS